MNVPKFTVRLEQTADQAAIYTINEQAFGRPAEAVLVDRLRAAGVPLISLVAEQDGQLIGHALFSPMHIEPAPIPALPIMGLGPVAVLPACQKQGVGQALIHAGLDACRAIGSEIVFVLGHPSYYPRFGFAPARPYGLQCAYEGVPDDAFMVLELRPGALNHVHGVAHYRPEFDGV